MTSLEPPEESTASPEPPECPVCLSPFAAEDAAGGATPRVLPCGHSLCGPCIAALPPPLAAAAGDAVRCPLCMQVVPYSRSLGPNSLPKNLALYPYINPSSGSGISSVKVKDGSSNASSSIMGVLPVPWSRRGSFAQWRNLILPENAIDPDEIREDPAEVALLGMQFAGKEELNEAVADNTIFPVKGVDLCDRCNSTERAELLLTSTDAQVGEIVGKKASVAQKEVPLDGVTGVFSDEGLAHSREKDDSSVSKNVNLGIVVGSCQKIDSNEPLRDEVRDDPSTLKDVVPSVSTYENVEEVCITHSRPHSDDDSFAALGSILTQQTDFDSSCSPEKAMCIDVDSNSNGCSTCTSDSVSRSSSANSVKCEYSNPPEKVTPLAQGCDKFYRVFVSHTSLSLGSPWYCHEKDLVRMLLIGEVALSEQGEKWFKPSYASNVVDILDANGGNVQTEIKLLVEATARGRGQVSRIYGVWMSILETEKEEMRRLFLVFESLSKQQVVLTKGNQYGFEMLQFGLLAMQMSEALMFIHSEGIVCGCIGLSCFSLDEYDHCILDLSRVLSLCRNYRKFLKDFTLGEVDAYVAPELVARLYNREHYSEGSVGPKADVWAFGCLLILLLTGDQQFVSEYCVGLKPHCVDEFFVRLHKRQEILAKLDSILSGTQFDFLIDVICACLSYDPKDRPQIVDVWCSIRGLFMKHCGGFSTQSTVTASQSFKCCLLLSDLSSPCFASTTVRLDEHNISIAAPGPVKDFTSYRSNETCSSDKNVDLGSLASQSNDGFKSITLRGHRHCISGLAVAGDFLFSVSHDKTINVWSLQDFSYEQTLEGHEHRIMAIVRINDDSNSVCISGDVGGGIFVWRISSPMSQEPMKKWYEQSDWRFTGIHCLAVSGMGYLYSGSGDRTIKVWSLQDYSLFCTLTGHRSTVSSLAIASGILYSGSWDGTVRLWWTSDHSPLSELVGDVPGSMAPVLQISTKDDLVISGYENGYLKIWKEDVLVRSQKFQNGAIYALQCDQQLLYTGGWDKAVNIQELSENDSEVDVRDIGSIDCNSVITSLLYWHGKIFVGLSNSEIKVFFKGP